MSGILDLSLLPPLVLNVTDNKGGTVQSPTAGTLQLQIPQLVITAPTSTVAPAGTTFDVKNTIISHYPQQITISASKVVYNVVKEASAGDNKTITVDDGLDLFTNAVINAEAPYIQLNTAEGHFRRIFSEALLPPLKIINNNIIYLLVSKYGLYDDKNRKESTTVLYEQLEFKLDDDEIHVSDMRIVPRIERALKVKLLMTPGISMEATTNIFSNNPEGIFADMTIISFLLLTDTDNNSRDNFYIEETEGPIYLKKHFNLHYQPKDYFDTVNEADMAGGKRRRAVAKINISNKIVTATNTISLGRPVGTRYIVARIHNADSQQMVDQMIKALEKLLTLYTTERAQIIANVTRSPAVLPDINLVLLTGASIVQKGKKTTTGYSEGRLGKQFPDIFRAGYAKVCPAQDQPTAVDAPTADHYRRQGRDVLDFPIGNPVVSLVCLNKPSERPYLSLVNNNTASREQYSHLPCCAKNPDSNLELYRRGELKTQIGSRSKSIIRTKKILGAGGVGQLPTAIKRFFIAAAENQYDWYRYGIPFSVNSVIHCMLITAKDRQYIIESQSTAADATERTENYVRSIRQRILRETYPGLYRQEMYDSSDSDITKYLAADSFFDPRLVFRGLEEFFNVNIFVFGDDTEEEGTFDIPRHKVFHSRPVGQYNRPTVCLFRTWGSTADNLKHPHCELIISTVANTDSRRIPEFHEDLHDARITNECYHTLKRITSNITWNDRNQLQQLYGYVDLSSETNYNVILRGTGSDLKGITDSKTPWRQYIDQYGKCRAFIVEVDIGDNSNNKMTICVPPTQPNNLPTLDPRLGDQLPLISYQSLKLLGGAFGKISGITVDALNNVTAVWYSLYQTMTFGLCVPIIAIARSAISDNLPVGPSIPITIEVSSESPIIGRINKMKRTLDILLQILMYLYYIEPIGAVNFYNRYCIIKSIPGDSANIYNFSRVNRRLPTAKSVNEAIAALQPLNTGLFTTSNEGNKIILYSPDFARKIGQKLQLFEKRYNVLRQIDEVPQGPMLLKNIYQKPDDFPQTTGVVVLIGDDSYNNWRDRQIASASKDLDDTDVNNQQITTTITAFNLRTLDPYLYRDTSGRSYLIQNTIANRSFDRATAICAKWLENVPVKIGDNKQQLVAQNINYGPQTEPLDEKHPYLLYTINNSLGAQQNTLVLIADNRGEARNEGQFIRLIKYFTDEEQYAAMLLL